ncbi:anhydro-N-acetylmuramic acid kinase [uncultured Winogradskyella sp.]|uniref:anhydro-N-acetylmuramic acid kinase n=1 Tax=uncultured Winogradskyella sp. TaxID=395353 RepID=UPI00260CE2AD|nr:anhydro-N-acetylmuramic acid kinase [uncultured Winogradskyella sp.]
MIKSEYNVVAVMSGTSLDGMDIIFATYVFKGIWEFKIHHCETVKYPKDWKLILSQLVHKSKDELRNIDEQYSQYLAMVILDFINQHKLQDIDFIASHGHTAIHQPEEGLTLQIGNRQILSDALNIKVICDFRVQDVKLGGQGAPLVPIGDRLLFSNYDYCLNLGGFANISFENNSERIAFDICPVNIVLNHYVSKLKLEYDDKGKLASKGKIDEYLLSKLNTLEFYQENPPKSLGLEWVETYVFPMIDTLNLEVENILRTFVEHIAIQISQSLKMNSHNILVTGGGVYNEFLISRLRSLSKSEIIIPNKSIVEFKEALIFGLLGILRERNEVNCLKSVTGARINHSSGKILKPNTQN